MLSEFTIRSLPKGAEFGFGFEARAANTFWIRGIRQHIFPDSLHALAVPERGERRVVEIS
jgi:hypothetical protein